VSYSLLRWFPEANNVFARLFTAGLLGLLPGVLPAAAESPPDIAALQMRAAEGNAEALTALGTAYATGAGVTLNYKEAARYFEKAAQKNHVPAQFALGAMAESGHGQPADPALAMKYYLKAAQRGHAPAQFNIGNFYANGIGVAQDLLEATVWYRQAASLGLPEAQHALAFAYETGRGPGKDEAEAVRWYREASAKKYPPSVYNLALMAEEGRGMERNDELAAELYRVAALRNYGAAQNNLGIMIAEGRGGLGQDMAESYAWLSLAVENGAKPSARDIVVRRMSEVQLAQTPASTVKTKATPRRVAFLCRHPDASRWGLPLLPIQLEVRIEIRHIRPLGHGDRLAHGSGRRSRAE